MKKLFQLRAILLLMLSGSLTLSAADIFSDTEPGLQPEIAKRIDSNPDLQEKVDSLFLFTRGMLNGIRTDKDKKSAAVQMNDFLDLLAKEPHNHIASAHLLVLYQKNPELRKTISERLRKIQKNHPAAVSLAIMVATVLDPVEKIDRKQSSEMLWHSNCQAEWEQPFAHLSPETTEFWLRFNLGEILVENALSNGEYLKAEQIVNTLKTNPGIFRCLPVLRFLLMYEKIAVENDPFPGGTVFPGTGGIQFPADSHRERIADWEERALE